MNDTAVIMPDRDTMFAALCDVHDDDQLKEGLYQEICENLAGQSKVAARVVLGLQLAVYDYNTAIAASGGVTVDNFMADFITAITPKEICQETLELWHKTLAHSKRRGGS